MKVIIQIYPFLFFFDDLYLYFMKKFKYLMTAVIHVRIDQYLCKQQTYAIKIPVLLLSRYCIFENSY